MRLEPAREQDERAVQLADKPWMAREDWAQGVCRSSTKTEALFMLGFALFWNLVSLPATILALQKYQSTHDLRLLAVLVFPLAGAWLALHAARFWIRWRKFGRSEFRLAATPGALGGRLKGSLWVPGALAAPEGIRFTLSCIHEYVSATGKDRSTHTTILWQDERIAHAPGLPMGPTQVAIEFAPPADLPASDPKSSSDRHLWRLSAAARVPGVDFSADFEVPVFSVAVDEADKAPLSPTLHLVEAGAETLFQSSMTSTGATVLSYGGGPARKAYVGLYPFTALWLGITYGIARFGAPPLFPIVFGFVGLVLLAICLSTLLEGSRITLENGRIFVRRYGRTTAFDAMELAEVAVGKGSGQTDRKLFHNVEARLKDGRKVVLAGTVGGRLAAESGVREFKRALGLY